VSTVPIKEAQLPFVIDIMKGIKDVDDMDVIQPENIIPSKK
jgi:hypothetical protein